MKRPLELTLTQQRCFVTRARCASDLLEDFDGELAIHLPGREGLDEPHVLVYPKLKTWLNRGLVEFVLPDEQIAQLKNGLFPGQR